MLAARQKMVTALAGWDIRSANTLRLMLGRGPLLSCLYSVLCDLSLTILYSLQFSNPERESSILFMYYVVTDVDRGR